MTGEPFAVPAQIETDLVRVRAYWRGLIRGYADMPDWDDFKPRALHELQATHLLIDVYLSPMRFRFRMVGERLMQEYGKEIADKFADKIELRSPLDQCSQQCAATVENSAPT